MGHQQEFYLVSYYVFLCELIAMFDCNARIWSDCCWDERILICVSCHENLYLWYWFIYVQHFGFINILDGCLGWKRFECLSWCASLGENFCWEIQASRAECSAPVIFFISRSAFWFKFDWKIQYFAGLETIWGNWLDVSALDLKTWLLEISSDQEQLYLWCLCIYVQHSGFIYIFDACLGWKRFDCLDLMWQPWAWKFGCWEILAINNRVAASVIGNAGIYVQHSDLNFTHILDVSLG